MVIIKCNREDEKKNKEEERKVETSPATEMKAVEGGKCTPKRSRLLWEMVIDNTLSSKFCQHMTSLLDITRKEASLAELGLSVCGKWRVVLDYMDRIMDSMMSTWSELQDGVEVVDAATGEVVKHTGSAQIKKVYEHLYKITVDTLPTVFLDLSIQISSSNSKLVSLHEDINAVVTFLFSPCCITLQNSLLRATS